MSEMVIFGGQRLAGEIRVSGAKNAALPILFATLLIEKEPVFLENIPDISDVRLTLSILESIGVRGEKSGDGYLLFSDEVCPNGVDVGSIGKIRGSSYLMGALLGRCGYVRMPLPGGCDFGGRPIDLHLFALEKLGAICGYEDGELLLTAKKLHGARIDFPSVSVGATVNAVLAAVSADGETLITNAAREPHVCDLCRFLNQCGARISGIGGANIQIQGGYPLHGCQYRIIDDVIELGTYLAAGVATGGRVSVCGRFFSSAESVILPLYEMGVKVSETADKIAVNAEDPFFATRLTTAPYPGFPTDLHPLFTLLLALSSGEGSLCETVWKERFRYLEELQKMGARVERRGTNVITNSSRLKGAKVRCVDLRAGAALVVAGLAAEGETVIENAELIARGYESIIPKLRALGAQIEKRQ